MFRREINEIARSFERSARILDQRLKDANPQLTRLDVTVEDRSNRSGLDQSGFPIYVWSYWFERRQWHNSYNVALLVEMSYSEPLMDDKPTVIDLRWVADVTRPGASCLFRSEETESLTFEDFRARGVASLVLERLELARRSVPGHLLVPTSHRPGKKLD
jgi:hypothetical protein